MTFECDECGASWDEYEQLSTGKFFYENMECLIRGCIGELIAVDDAIDIDTIGCEAYHRMVDDSLC